MYTRIHTFFAGQAARRLTTTLNLRPTSRTLFDHLAKKYHPDMNPNSDRELFQQVRQAYELISKSLESLAFNPKKTNSPQMRR